jgi:hypothetical protein
LTLRLFDLRFRHILKNMVSGLLRSMRWNVTDFPNENSNLIGEYNFQNEKICVEKWAIASP